MGELQHGVSPNDGGELTRGTQEDSMGNFYGVGVLSAIDRDMLVTL